MGVLGVVTAVLFPGGSPYFVFPALVAALALMFFGRGGKYDCLLLAVGALPAVVVWTGLMAQAEQVLGLSAHALFTTSAAFAVLPLLIFADIRKATRRHWAIATAVVAFGALMLAVGAGRQPAFSAAAPQRLNIHFIDDHRTQLGLWTAETRAPLPDAMMRAGFAPQPERILPQPFTPQYALRAGAFRYPALAPHVTTADTEAGERATLTLADDAAHDSTFVIVPADFDLQSVEIASQHFAAPRQHPLMIRCTGPDCATYAIALTYGTKAPRTLTLVAQRQGLPEDGGSIASVRPTTARPSHGGDTTMIIQEIALP
jgi:hypothetical protein